MGRQIIWDGNGIPEIGDEVLFEVASSPEVQRGRVKHLHVTRYEESKLNSWRIEVHMVCKSEECKSINGEYPMCRLLEDVHPLTWQKVWKKVAKNANRNHPRD